MGWAKYEEDDFDAFYERIELKESNFKIQNDTNKGNDE